MTIFNKVFTACMVIGLLGTALPAQAALTTLESSLMDTETFIKDYYDDVVPPNRKIKNGTYLAPTFVPDTTPDATVKSILMAQMMQIWRIN